MSVVPKLQQLAGHSPKDYTELHDLWTLDGLHTIDNEILKSALSDSSPYVRAAAIRIAEPTFGQADNSLKKEVMNLIDDSTHIVQRQLAASMGEFPASDRREALLAMAARHGEDPVVVSLIISTLPNQEFTFLEHLLNHSANQPGATRVAKRVTEVMLQSGTDANVNAVLNWIGDQNSPLGQRRVLLGVCRTKWL